MPESDEGGFRCCCRFILTLGFTALFMWLSLRTTNPKCSIQYMYLPALNKSLNSQQTNTTLYFQLKLDNPNKDKGIQYDALNLTFYYPQPNKTTIQAPNIHSNIVIPGFYQGHQKKAKRVNSVETRGLNWSQVVLENQVVSIRVELVAAVRFKILAWKTSKHSLMLGANIQLNDQGEKVNKKGIRLKSGTFKLTSHCALVILLVIFSSLILNS